MFRAIKTFAGDRRGVTTIEYGIVAVAVSIVAVALLISIGGDLVQLFGRVLGAYPA